MTAQHLEFLVEEPSMEAFLRALLPRLLPEDRTFEVHPFQGKDDLLNKLEARLRGYAQWLPDEWRVVVVVDRDGDDCMALKRQLDAIAVNAGLRTRTRVKSGKWQVVNRIAVEELEAWYFGDWEAVRAVYPRVPSDTPKKSGFRDPDMIRGGTWEAFERILRQHRHFTSGLRKIEAARAIGAYIEPTRSISHSFKKFHEAIIEAVA
jgi:hypothetical protein